MCEMISWWRMKMNEIKENGVIHHIIDMKNTYWEEIKEDPGKLGRVLSSIMNSVLDTHIHDDQEKPRCVFTGFEEHPIIDKPEFTKLIFNFECYDIADEEEKEKFLSLIDEEGRINYE